MSEVINITWRNMDAATKKVIDAARLFCESTLAEMDELEGTQSASAPAEFMLLHESVREFDGKPKEKK